ncbi:MAG TPA: histidine kinase dimerization/phospho-acceptor domain-containing protein, partial [Longimicrobium sp.]|nr:histidine kinase dimerization/phospho-acceptor domain-containing protein [Longimicrobium sp.]
MNRLETPQAAEARVDALERQQAEDSRVIADLQARDALKTQFLANISHDLRTPLTAMITHAEILRDGILGEL